MGQAQEVAVGIIARGPNHGSKPLHGPEDIKLELVCARAPRQGPHHPPDGGDGKAPQGYARGIIKTYAFDDKDFIYEVEDDEEEEEEEEAEDGEYYDDDNSATGTYVDCPESSAAVL